ncbi:MAG: hypothetical protein AMS23_11035 [Bacteroides sp. SM1_62]|nr:MAG: hypothetical protein AMS23_11035 [Bacteroides sp. SM1_62]
MEIIPIKDAIGQTKELEMAHLYEMVKSGQITNVTFNTYGKEWNNLLAEMGGYPDLPYNERTKSIEFSQVLDLPNIDKRTIYNRILEWSALHFGSLNSVIHYDDFETGKIILKGWFGITYKFDTKSFWGIEKESISLSECSETYIFTIKDNKVKIEITNLQYESTIGGMYVAGSYIPESKTYRSIHSLYPITKDEPITWKGKLSLLEETKDNITLYLTSLYIYIENHINDYNF